jgi:3'-phosphoadenosine 5'-phosphosulfate sulfotransferase (PAPS reductase)/FAD synthetase
MEKQKYYVASFSGGKDSTAMVLRMIEIGERIDEVVCCDTYKEFPAMYRHIEKVKRIIEDAGIKFTTLRSEKSFDYYMFEHLRSKGKFVGEQGLGWPTPTMRWCTGNLKRDITKKYLREMRKKYDVIQYLGIAADEDYRLERKNNQQVGHKHPLVEWGWSEKNCLEYCYAKGYDWEGLYEIFNRVSCWCCPLKSFEELRKLRKHRPQLWEELKDMDKRARNQFTARYSVEDLEKRFALEDELTARGHSITNRAFHTDMKRMLAGETTIDEIINERERQIRIPME